ncbi:hypothetical protein [uncultured Desulfovibrio sp.]|uniref:Uncharacterized protein n=1 Tax=Candidatus Desulfovibrio intestinavium TaxID=2838534 RepID=A0A9D2HMV8_9BACT|nr:hypothetical protein [uncultured Desulfovibrio sp.]HJA79157.1 hypothetical protein [Candidatus Desulfovibrio intestinavium]
MKKIIAALALALTLAVGSAPALAAQAAAKPTNPVDQFTGHVWLQTSRDNKAAFLFGVETAITVEYFVNSKVAEKAAKEGKAPSSNLSRFEKGWMTAMKEYSRDQIIEKIDAWYAANPDKQDIPVMNVIWFSLIKPALAASK